MNTLYNLLKASPQAIKRLSPKYQFFNNPVILYIEIATLIAIFYTYIHPSSYTILITIWLILTCFFSTLSETYSEKQAKAHANSLKHDTGDVQARLVVETHYKEINPNDLNVDDIVEVRENEIIPTDGDVIKGIASVDESSITGESAPVIREADGDRTSVIGGTKVLSDVIHVRVTAKKGSGFMDRIVNLIEGAKRKKTPNELGLKILLTSLSIIFIIIVFAIVLLFKITHVDFSLLDAAVLFVALAPTTIGALLSAIGIAGIHRLMQHNIVTTSGRAVEASGDVDTLLLDKTGTITLGNRQAVDIILTNKDIDDKYLAEAAQLSSLHDETPEGRSIVVLCKNKYNIRTQHIKELNDIEFIPFSAKSRMSGVNLKNRIIRKGAPNTIYAWVRSLNGDITQKVERAEYDISIVGGTPLLVAEQIDNKASILGVIYLKDVLKTGIRDKFAQLKKMAIKTVMITGDNNVTAKIIARDAGVDNYLAEATPEDKMNLIQKEQQTGKLVAMTGDGTNDAPALAQADVAVAMNTGTAAAKDAANMIDLDSSPTKLIDIVNIGKNILITRGALTTLSIANDIAKYFTIFPLLSIQFTDLNILMLHDKHSALLSTVIFNALIIPALIPIALKGVKYKSQTPNKLLIKNFTLYGLIGFVLPFICIKLIDLIIEIFF